MGSAGSTRCARGARASFAASTLRRPARDAAAAVALFALTACAPSPAMVAVERGDRAALHAHLERREKLGNLGDREAAALAKAVAERELKTASPDEAIDRVDDLRSCAHELDGALAVRMRTHDAAGAQAALVRIESRSIDAREARAFVADGDPHWRAVGARGLIRLEDRDPRRRAMVDPSPIVRREAVRAAHDAADPDDRFVLAEAARLDPEPIVRTEAVRAIAALASGPFDARRSTADVLRDLWAAGDDGLREDIAVAWSGAGLWGEGGRDALRTIVAASHGVPAVEAAAAVLRRRDADRELASLATAQLVSAIRSGSRVSRLQALAEAPLDRGELMAAVRSASDDGDPSVRISALARLVGASDQRARVELEALASPGSPVASRARMASAMAGDRRVQSWIESDLASEAEGERISAAIALAALGVASRAAPLLADPVPRVRSRVSCIILMAARRTGS